MNLPYRSKNMKVTPHQMKKDYDNFKHIVRAKPMPKSTYYKSLIKYRKELIQDIDDRNQTIVAEELGMHQTRLSALVQILKYIDSPDVREYLLTDTSI